MTKDDWRALTFWCAASGAFLTVLVLAHVLTIVAVTLLMG